MLCHVLDGTSHRQKGSTSVARKSSGSHPEMALKAWDDQASRSFSSARNLAHWPTTIFRPVLSLFLPCTSVRNRKNSEASCHKLPLQACSVQKEKRLTSTSSYMIDLDLGETAHTGHSSSGNNPNRTHSSSKASLFSSVLSTRRSLSLSARAARTSSSLAWKACLIPSAISLSIVSTTKASFD